MTQTENDAVLHGWVKSSFEAAGFARDVYRRGSGPGVIIVHEIPGITPKVAAFANWVRQSASLFFLGFNPRNAAQQFTGLANAIARSSGGTATGTSHDDGQGCSQGGGRRGFRRVVLVRISPVHAGPAQRPAGQFNQAA